MLTHLHMVVYTWWCWCTLGGVHLHIGEETEANELFLVDRTWWSNRPDARVASGQFKPRAKLKRVHLRVSDQMRCVSVRSE
jgi:hypothetical protein